MVTQDDLKLVLRYKKGKLYWIKNVLKNIKNIGTRAGYANGNSYRRIRISGKIYDEHRVIYTLMFGEIPKGYWIDHKDRNVLNNDIDNLRLCTPAQSAHNVGLKTTNKSGFKGVTYEKRMKKWQAASTINGVKKYLGYFETPELASEKYKEFVLKRHFEFANVNDV